MPIYEFKCQACGTEIEVLQKISDPHLTDCKACGKAEMKKKVTAAAFRLSGAGWYETDFKAGDKKKNLTETNTEKTDQKTGVDSNSNSSSGEASKSAETTNSGEASNSGNTSKTSKEGSDKATTKTEKNTTPKTSKDSSSE